ncbi:DUF732 domain-containing protein [Mycolicibacillus trivialis]|uniref:DUF732 domain-containing protein n=1 Tax=Mycolicibacillus trivialis TaxID=1798 RepID=A0A1X2EL79_9MYCO|nr:DUF732 domain-containing protein [Mycolicibacillus trivialis]ORX05775.1 hypothetical protein AWC30_08060 [Mycolicibacillus trivialis]
MKRHLLLAGVAATMIAIAAPAHADPTAPDTGDAGFLAALDQAGVHHNGPAQAVAAGRAVCRLMDGGLSPVDTVNAVRSTNPGFSVQQSAVFAGVAATAYCPQHL